MSFVRQSWWQQFELFSYERRKTFRRIWVWLNFCLSLKLFLLKLFFLSKIFKFDILQSDNMNFIIGSWIDENLWWHFVIWQAFNTYQQWTVIEIWQSFRNVWVFLKFSQLRQFETQLFDINNWIKLLAYFLVMLLKFRVTFLYSHIANSKRYLEQTESNLFEIFEFS